MTAQIITTTTGIQEVTSSGISWEHEFEGSIQSGNALVVFVGGVDSQTPSPTVATISGSGLSPSAELTLTLAGSITGPGGSSFPSAWVFTLGAPVHSATSTGTITGTISIGFDETIGRMNGMSAIVSGTNGTHDGVATFVQHTQVPDFSISGTHTTTGTNTILVDMCMSESSNHQDHVLGNNQSRVGDVFFTGPKYSTSFKDAPLPGSVGMVRTQVGGPFAGVSLIILGLESE